MSFAVITIILDSAILLLPVPHFMCLQLSTKQRMAAFSLFGLGYIVCISGIVQAYYIDVALKKSYDETWDGWSLWVASAVQVDIGILCVSIPAIRPWVAIYIPKLLESTGMKDAAYNPFRHPAKFVNGPWVKDLESGGIKKASGGSSEASKCEVGMLGREISGSEEKEVGCDRDSKVRSGNGA
ncbi:MAG: hypothetical protein LQ346_007365 [Caloplaca aetnensis]|nr:MAG: hypothetical protein LQ346_007365 [Caloplaca aetnensis]